MADSIDDLTLKQRRFCLEYIKDRNGAQAAKRAGYAWKHARIEASSLLKKPVIRNFIRSAIADQESRLKIDGDKVIKELARIAFFDSEALELVATGGAKLSDLTRDERAAIAEVTSTEYTWTEGRGEEAETHKEVTTKVKAHSKTKALEILAKHFNLFKEEPDDKDKVTGALKLVYSKPGES